MRRLDPSYEEVFALFLDCRVMSARDLHARHYARSKSAHWNPRTQAKERGAISERAVASRLQRLVERGYVVAVDARYPRDSGRGRRFAYRLTTKGETAFPRLERRSLLGRRAPLDDGLALLRSAIVAALIAEGWAVGRGGVAALHLRRFLLDSASPEVAAALRQVLAEVPVTPDSNGKAVPLDEPFRCSVCGYLGPEVAIHRDGAAPCPGVLSAHDVLPFDVFYRVVDRRVEAGVALFLESAEALGRDLRALPLWTPGQPRLPTLVRFAKPLLGSAKSEALGVLAGGPGFEECTQFGHLA